MCRGRRVRAAVLIAAAFVVCWRGLSAGPSWAADADDARVILFSGGDFWRNGAFAHGGLLTAPGGFNQEGFLFKLLLSGGQYRYNANGFAGERVTGSELSGQVMPGWRIKRGDVEIKYFFGLDIQKHRLSPDDPSNQLRGRSTGLRMAAELWYEPTPATLIAGDVSLSSIATSHTARAAFAWRLLDRFYLGPEIAHYASDGYRHLRLGAHVTGLKFYNYEMSAAGGWARDSDRRASPYLRFGVMMRQ